MGEKVKDKTYDNRTTNVKKRKEKSLPGRQAFLPYETTGKPPTIFLLLDWNVNNCKKVRIKMWKIMELTKPKTNGEQMENKRSDGTFAPGHKLGNRFPKGQSGNEKGRPKLTRLTESLREQIAAINPDAPEQTIAEQIAQTLIRLAIAGDVQAIREIADRTEGKPKQAIDLDMQVKDWRELAQSYGISENDVISEARLLIEQSVIDNGSE